MALPTNAVVPPASLILVTGASGLYGTWIIDECLKYGYRVRGTVRDPQSEKSKWLVPHFEEAYGKGSFELVQVKDVAAEGSLDDAVKGCDGVIHTASVLTFTPDPNEVIPPSVAMVENALKSSLKEPKLKRFVFTSSSSAAKQYIYNEPYDLTADSYDEEAVRRAWEPPPYNPDRILDVYNASKVLSEQALWRFVQDRKPHFEVNSVVIEYSIALPVNLQQQGYPSSLGLSKMLWDGRDGWQILYPQNMLDGRDGARLHVAGLAHPGLKGERIFGYAHNKTWTDWIARLRRIYPDHKFPDPPPNEGVDMGNIVGRRKAEDALRWLGRDGFRPMEDTMRELFDSFARGEK